MEAAILVEQHKPLALGDVKIPELSVGQVLVKVAFSGICGKQIDEITGTRGGDRFLPHLLGHEGSGVVQEVGPGVRKVKAGDHVVLHWMKGSGIDSIPPRYDWDGIEVSAGWITTFSEYTIVSENRLTPVGKTHAFDELALLGCAVTTGLGIVFNDAAVMPGQSVAVFGAGGVGFNVIQGAALVNAHPIVAVDIQDAKLETAKSFGATHVVNSKTQDPVEALNEISGGKGFDVVVDTTGNTEAFQAAYTTTSNYGKTILAGVLHHERPIQIDPFAMHFGRQVIASHGGNTKPDVDIPRYLRLHELGRLKLKEQITQRFPLKDVNMAVDTVRRGEALRCLLEMDH